MIVLWLISRKLQKVLKETEERLADDVKKLMDRIIFMRTETHNNVIFAYNAITNDFVCQGKDMEELNSNFGLRFPGSKGVIVKPDEEGEVVV
jgi:hypothetical protein